MKILKSFGDFTKGLADGLPICLGYLSVSFAFGIFAVGNGLSILEAFFMSATNVTSAGQLSAVPIIACGGSLLELSFTQFIINLRYSLMSVSLSQKFDGSIRLRDRFVIAFVNTDEVFAVASSKKDKVGKSYMYGLIILPFVGWSVGTLIGAAAGAVFPPIVTNALGIAIYGMFAAICIPAAREDTMAALCMLTAVVLSCAFKYIPMLSVVSQGFVIIICSVAASALFAYIDCKKEERRSVCK